MITTPSLISSQFLGACMAPPSPLRPPSRTSIRLSPRLSAAAHTSAPQRPSHVRAVDQAAASLYDVLGLSPSATDQEIKFAYRRLARACHPDARRGASADEFMRVHTAYATLSDPEKRADYDRSLMVLTWKRRSSGSTAFSPSSFSFSRSSRRTWETDQCW